MSKLTITLLALLCLYMTSCTTDLILDEQYENQQVNQTEDTGIISSRSTNGIDLTFTPAAGSVTNMVCSKVTATAVSTSTMSIYVEFAFSSPSTYLVSTIDAFGIGQDLAMTYQDGTAFLASEAELDACTSNICYSTTLGNPAGSTSSFIIDEDLVGL